MIEALAFEEEPPEFGEKDDLTMPDNENMVQEAEKELLSFRVLVPQLGYPRLKAHIN